MRLSDILIKIEENLQLNGRLSNGIPQAGVLIPLYEKDGMPHVLLTQRSSKLRKHSGQISFPGGTMEESDETIIETALRETHEEIGLSPEHFVLYGKFHDFRTPYYSCVTPIIGVFDYPATLTIQEDEIERILEVPISDLLDTKIYRNEIWLHEGEKHLIHFYDWSDQNGEHHNIWGATAGVLFNMLQIIVE